MRTSHSFPIFFDIVGHVCRAVNQRTVVDARAAVMVDDSYRTSYVKVTDPVAGFFCLGWFARGAVVTVPVALTRGSGISYMPSGSLALVWS